MNLYRAQYRTKSGNLRRMTFAAPDAIEARRIAEDWQLSDDNLAQVRTLRPLQDQLRLTNEVMQ